MPRPGASVDPGGLSTRTRVGYGLGSVATGTFPPEAWQAPA